MVEVAWNEGQHFGTVREKLDKFSTFRGMGACSWSPVANKAPEVQERGLRAGDLRVANL